MNDSPHPLQDHALNAWNRELYWWWDLYNWQYLHEALRRPIISLADTHTRLGSWDRARRVITIARDHIVRDSWNAVTETLRHEMAHQFVDEILCASDERPHAAAFREACARLRIDSHAAAPSTPAPASEADRGVRSTILKLLSLATSPNEHEAQAALKKARELLLKYNIDQAELEPENPYAVRRLGQVRARHPSHENELAAILNEFFFVEIIWAISYDTRTLRHGRILELFGTRFNLDMAEYVYRYVLDLLPALWESYRSVKGLPDQRHRLSYYSGVLRGLHEKLGQQDRYFRTERALVWTGDVRLTSFFRHHHPRVTHQSSCRTHDPGTYWAGVREGKEIVIRQPISSTGGRTRGLLPS